jgi:hypothetical protein
MTLAVWEGIIFVVAFAVALAIAAYSWRKLHEFSLVVVLWVLLAWLIGRGGFFASPTQFSPDDLLGFLAFGTLMSLPVVLFALAWWRVAPFRAFITSVPLPLVVGVQVYRVVGVVFLWMLGENLVPPALGIPTGIADLAVGVLALPLAFALARGVARARGLAIAWCAFGIADFVLAISVVSVAFLGLVQLQPDPAAIGRYPLTLISLFQVPLSICLHVLALWGLRRS